MVAIRRMGGGGFYRMARSFLLILRFLQMDGSAFNGRRDPIAGQSSGLVGNKADVVDHVASLV